jgi:drug/metabolite transporter (DMT)-like permease
MSFDWKILLALAAVYIIWSSTYLAIRIAVHEIAPLLMNGFRFVIAGLIMIIVSLFTGQKIPGIKLWLNAGLVGTLMFLGGTGFVAMAEVTVSSSLAAIAITTVSLWACLITGLFGKWPNKFEWIGLGIGFLGILLLNLEKDMQASSFGAVMLILAPATWALGSVLSRKLKVPAGFMGYGIEMFTGGIANIMAGLLIGEHLGATPSAGAWFSVTYLIVFGSIIGFTAYMFLFENTGPALATSYSYVNPVGAVIIGVLLAGETINREGIAALAAVLIGVIFVAKGEIEDRKSDSMAVRNARLDTRN